ncbi:protein EI24 homolog isoform X2 [Ananas comosus]|uniref:Protein EI24 homolog isoform X2 n=1 Tax=Ananas comosus TaxID=4615 RepID=A0A6P5GYZ6_ANACO|nr:protein EI24 homolog isoform X2 [Ananas comosus]
MSSSAAAAAARRAKEAAILWVAGFREACCLHRVVFFCASSRTLLIRTGQCFLLNGLIFLGRYNDIAKHAFDVLKSNGLPTPRELDDNNKLDSQERPGGLDGVILGIGEQVYSVLLLTIFFIEVFVTGFIPYFGKAINFLLLTWMYAYYCFEYKWNFLGVSLNKRLDFFESNWAFFSGFGSPCVLPTFFFSPLVSYGVMAILYPLFVLTAAGTEAEDVIDSRRKSWGGEPEKIQIFYVARRFSTLVLQLFPGAQKEH